MSDTEYKFLERETMDMVWKYIEKQYQEGDNVNLIELINSRQESLYMGNAYLMGSIMQSVSDYGRKNYDRNDLFRVVHYALIMLYLHHKNMPHIDYSVQENQWDAAPIWENQTVFGDADVEYKISAEELFLNARDGGM